MVDLEQVSSALNYDPATGVFTWKHDESNRPQWNAQYAGKRAGSMDNQGYWRIKLNYRDYKAHRLAWLISYGEFPDGQVDHINGVKHDNRIENLRVVDAVGNARNQKVPSNNTSGVIGVYWCCADKRWISTIRVMGDRIRLLSDVDFFEAVCARKSAENTIGFHPNHGRPA